MITRRSDWIETLGGPIVVMPDDLLAFWEGSNPPSSIRTISTSSKWNDEGPATDYDRACEVGGLLGQLDVVAGQVIVLNDEPLPTAWFVDSRRPNLGAFVRWVYAPSDLNVDRAVAAAMDAGEWIAEATWRIGEPRLHAFDASLAGCDIDEGGLQLHVAPGPVNISTKRHRYDDDTEIVLHRLLW